MAEILSLSKARKAKGKSSKEQAAAENRVRFGRTKAEKVRAAAELQRAEKATDAHKRKD